MTRQTWRVGLAVMLAGGLVLLPGWIWPSETQVLPPISGNPAFIPGLTLWYAANSLALADGDAIAAVADKSAGGYAAAQGTAGFRPLYKTSLVNALPGMRFDGSDDALTFSSLSLGTSHTIALVVNMTGGSSAASASTWLSGNRAFFSHQKDSADSWAYSITSTPGAAIGYVVSSTADTYSSSFRVVTMVRENTAVAWYKNGAAAGSGTLGANTAMALTTVGSTATPVAKGDLAEVLIYTSALSTAQRMRLERYLCRKYQVTCS